MTTVARPLAAPNTTLPGLALSILTASLGISIVMVALPRLSEAFATSIAASQWVVLSFILASTVASVIIGRLADVAGRRRLLAGCLLLFAGASVLAFAAPNLAVLLAARGIQGVAAAGMMALPMALIRDLLPPERSGTAMGVLGSTSAIGTALGPSVGGLLLGQYGWRSVFLVLVPMALGTLLLLMRSLPRDVPSARRSGGLLGDPAGTLLLAVTLVAYSLSMTLGGGLFWPLLAATALGAAVLAGIERRAAAPLIPPRCCVAAVCRASSR
ncbi:MFS transporter [Albibacillus kandeliae]|uniref:MFS transporter n=1 Tax=Albibacillus kandeliae TaxID=2174228 RepID=UPI0018E51C20